jgi:hypothetical protein
MASFTLFPNLKKRMKDESEDQFSLFILHPSAFFLIIEACSKIGKPVTGCFEKPDSSTMISKVKTLY